MSVSKKYGMAVGLALGDALGLPHEFYHNRKNKYTGNLEYEPSLHSRWQGTTNFPIGSVSDDTEMTLALLQCLSDNKWNYNEEKVITAYSEWVNSGTTMLGKNTRYLFKGIKTIKGYRGRWAKLENKEKLQSNGCLMRCSPLALLDEGSFLQAVRTDVNLTNPNELCREVVTLHVKALRMALAGAGKKDILTMFSKECKSTEVKEVMQQAEEKKTRRDIKEAKGWILHAFYCVVYSLHNFTTYTQAVNETILMGGDTDTNASIVGGLWGALTGIEKLNEEQEKNILILLGEDHRPAYAVSRFIKLLNY